MTAPAGRWVFGLALSPIEIDALRAGKRVTRTYPEPIPQEPPLLTPEDIDAMKGGKHVMKLFEPARTLQVGDVLSVTSSEYPLGPPAVLPAELEALRAGRTLTKTGPAPPPADALPDLRVKVIDYQHERHDHIYTFEAV